MISYYIIIIIIIVCIEVYFRLYNSSPEKLENDMIDNYTPWIKIKHYNNYAKYYIKINNIDDKKLEDWKDIENISINYDINTNYLILKCKTEEEALVIANLFISNMNNEIELDEIIDNDMINISYKKAKKYKFVKNKLTELIKENLSKLEVDVKETDTFTNNYYDTNNLNKEIIINNIVNDYSRSAVDSKHEDIEIPKKIEKMDEICSPILNKVDENIIYEIKPQEHIQFQQTIQAYGGSEYATLSF